MSMLFASFGGPSASTLFVIFLILAGVGWAMNQKQKEKERKAQAEQQMRMHYGLPPRPSLMGQFARGVGSTLLTGIVKGVLGYHGHHRHHG